MDLVSLRADGIEPLGKITPQKITDQEIDTYKEQERFLPIANIGRLMKKCLPDSTKVSKDAKEIVQECTSEFISFITAEAAEKCLREKRKTINGEDILAALNTLGFENYEGALRIYLSKYRDFSTSTGKRVSKVKGDLKRKAEDSTSDNQGSTSKQAKNLKQAEEEEFDDEYSEEDD